MKLSSLSSLLLLSAGFAGVAAAPIRVVITSIHPPPNFGAHTPHTLANSHEDTPVGLFRFGHAMAPENIRHHQGSERKSPRLSCKMRMKALRITNWLREQVGLPPVIPHPHRGPHFHGHQPGFEGPHHMEMHDGHHQLSPPPAFEIRPLKVEGHLHHRPTAVALPSQFYDFRTSSFMDRLANAIMSLGPWEGRAVAFVLGCGLGSLIRMFWVMVILAFRYRSSKPAESEVFETVFIYEDREDNLPLAPPQYSDEKVTVTEEQHSA